MSRAKPPKTRNGGRWSEARFWGFIRSLLRQGSTRWQPIADTMRRDRRDYHGPNKRQKFEHQCELCGGWFAAKEIEIDHIEPCGTLKTFADLPQFVERLFCEADKMRKTCRDCNQTRKGEA